MTTLKTSRPQPIRKSITAEIMAHSCPKKKSASAAPIGARTFCPALEVGLCTTSTVLTSPSARAAQRILGSPVMLRSKAIPRLMSSRAANARLPRVDSLITVTSYPMDNKYTDTAMTASANTCFQKRRQRGQ